MFCLQPVNKLSKNNVENLVNSIDYVFFDIDGVLRRSITPITGAQETVAKLRKLGKKIAFVTNNSFTSIRSIKDNLKLFGATEDEIIVPTEVTLAYLKRIDFKRDIYVVGCSVIKNLLKEAGYNVIEYKDITLNPLEETVIAVKEMSLKALEICKNVGAVIIDFDVNLTLGSLQVAQFILNHIKDVKLLIGIDDDMAAVGVGMKVVISKFYADGIKRWTNQEPVHTAKPGRAIADVLNMRYNISDNSRVLFIGDNVETDIELGINSGYQTCLVLTGVTSRSEVEKWKFPENLKPNYVAEGLGEIYEKIKDL